MYQTSEVAGKPTFKNGKCVTYCSELIKPQRSEREPASKIFIAMLPPINMDEDFLADSALASVASIDACSDGANYLGIPISITVSFLTPLIG